MAIPPSIPGLSLGISPSSSATSSTGLDNVGGFGGFTMGNISVGDGATSNSPFTGLVRDGAIALAVAYGAFLLWKRIT